MRRLTTVAIALAVAVGLSIPAAASATSFTYSLAGTGTVIPGCGGLDCAPTTMDSTGTAECSVCAPGKPSGGTFNMETVVRTYLSDPCKVKRVSGTLEVVWDNAAVSTANVSGKFRDSKALALGGAFLPSDPIYPTDPMKVLLNNYPPNPCVAASNAITGSMVITG